MRQIRPVQAASETDRHTDGAVLQRYYSERDYVTSPEGIMKLVSVVLCIVLSVVMFSASCAGVPLRVAGASLELTCAAVLACLSAVRLLQLAIYAPMGYWYADVILSTVIGIVLLVPAVLGLTLCDLLRVGDYVHGDVFKAEHFVSILFDQDVCCINWFALLLMLDELASIFQVLGIANAVVVTGSAVVTYVSVTRRWDAARGTPAPLPPPPPPDQEV